MPTWALCSLCIKYSELINWCLRHWKLLPSLFSSPTLSHFLFYLTNIMLYSWVISVVHRNVNFMKAKNHVLFNSVLPEKCLTHGSRSKMFVKCLNERNVLKWLGLLTSSLFASTAVSGNEVRIQDNGVVEAHCSD